MHKSGYSVRASLTLVGVLAVAGGGAAAPVLPRQTLKAETVAAWTKAGAQFGYLPLDEDGTRGFYSADFDAARMDLPAFSVTWPNLPYCARLPAPEAAFALIVYPHPFDYTGEKPPAKEPPAGLVDIDVSNLVRVRRLSLSGATEEEAGRLLNGLQRLRHIESLELSMPAPFLTRLAAGPAFPKLRTMSVICPATEEALRVVGELKQLTHLRVTTGPAIDPKKSGHRGHPIGLRHLAGLPALRSLRLDWCQALPDEELAHAARIQDLRELSLERCELITGKGLNELAAARKLESLNIAEGPVTDGEWTEVGKLAALRWLRVGGADVTDAGLARIAAIPGLTELTLKGCDQVTDDGYARLAAHKGLEALGVWFGRNLGEDGTRAIGGLRRLRHLRTEYCPGVTDKRLDHFADLVHLRELDLRGCTALTDAGVAKLTRFRRLEELHLWSCPQLTEKCLPAVCTLRELRVLEFYLSMGLKPDDRDFAVLGELPKLERLTLSNCRRVTGEGYRALARLPRLYELGLRECPALTDATLKEWAAAGRLKVLVLYMTDQVTDAGLQGLTLLPLRQLWIVGCVKVTPDGIASFRQAKPWCRLDIRPDWTPPQGPRRAK